MRELKFRAWDKNKKEFIDWFDISCVGVVWTQEINCDPEYPDVVIEQYTGLKDKNGKEIYEGDFIKLEDGNAKYLVVFEDGMFGLKWAGTPYLLYNIARTLDVEDGEVIGNIHENKELLGGEI